MPNVSIITPGVVRLGEVSLERCGAPDSENGVSRVGPIEAMTQDQDKSTGNAGWTALAGFTDPAQLELAIGSLASKGLGCERICLLASVAGFERMRRNVADALDGTRSKLDRTGVVGKLADGTDLIMAPCDSEFTDIDLEHERRTLGLLDGLDERMAAGSVILLVHAKSPQELVDVTNILLSHSSLRVRTRERPSR